MGTLGTALVVLRIVLGLIPQILTMIKEEQDKGTGRDQMADEVLGRFKDVSDRAKKARDTARDDIARNGVRDSGDPFQRD